MARKKYTESDYKSISQAELHSAAGQIAEDAAYHLTFCSSKIRRSPGRSIPRDIVARLHAVETAARELLDDISVALE